MTKEQIQENYTALDTEQCKWWVNHLFSMAKEQACNSGNFEDGEEMQAAQDKIIKILEHDANLDNRAEQLKTELREILDSYSGIRFIDITEKDVDKFKEEMSKAQLPIYPIKKEAVIYHGCYDCECQPEPLMTCDWLYHQTTIYTQCPRWKARTMPPKQCE